MWGSGNDYITVITALLATKPELQIGDKRIGTRIRGSMGLWQENRDQDKGQHGVMAGE